MYRDLKKTFRFREFPVYRDGRLFVSELKKFSNQKFPKEEIFALRLQLWRALDSILLNIAEGSDRGTEKDFARFLNNSHTSLNEVVVCLDVALDNQYISTEEHTFWLEQAANLVSQITAFRRALLNTSKVKGQRSKVSDGFTLVELIIYIAIIAGILIALLSFIQYIMNARTKAYVIQEVHSNTRTAMTLVEQLIREADGVNIGASTLGSDPGVLSLSMASSSLDPTIIDLTVDDGSLRVTRGSGEAEILTSEHVRVENFITTRIGSGKRKDNIRIQMTVAYDSDGSDVYYTYAFPVTSTVTLRK
ncbi:MAG: four helix bundle protein [Candidatus Magasanikbacteria bacterium]